MTFRRFAFSLLLVVATFSFFVMPRWNESCLAAQPAAGTVRTNSIGMKLAYIPPGHFAMGSPESQPGRHRQEVLHWVCIADGFYLGTHEITQHQYARVMGVNPSHFSQSGGFARRVRGIDTANHPVDSVSWRDAVAFCRRLSKLPAEVKTGRTYRLPTEAEWEFACRAGEDTTWSFGDDAKRLGDYAWYGRDRAGHRTHPVGTKQANRWGLYDMHGNVWEWCADRHARDFYAAQKNRQKQDNVPMIDPAGPQRGDALVIRGGGWFSPAANTRSAARRGDPPIVKEPDSGFRVVMRVRPQARDESPLP